MDNQVFLPHTFAEIYNNTPACLRGQDSARYKTVLIACIKYGEKPAEIRAIYTQDIDYFGLILTDTNGIVL